MKKLLFLSFLLMLILTFCLNFSFAEIITHTVVFNKSDLTFSKFDNYDIVTLTGLEVSSDLGYPQLPFYPLNLLIPEGDKIARVEIVGTKNELLDGDYFLLPVQKPEILSSALIGSKKISFTRPDSIVYAADFYYPGQLIENMGNRYIGNFNIGSVHIYPLQYQPVERKLKFHSEITLRIVTQRDREKLPKNVKLTAEQSQIFNNFTEKLVTGAGKAKLIKSINQNIELATPVEDYQYIIITSSTLESNFVPLHEWKKKKGVPSKIVTVEWIYNNFLGIDNPEKIRNFIKYAYENWGTIWVLLGGDANIVPPRTAFAMDCEFGADPRENDIPCDLYYADVDGSWNNDGDNIYGEISDDVDLCPEVFIGRAPVEDAAEADIFVNKILTYEKNPPLGYQRDILFAAEILWPKPYTNTGIAKDMIEDESLPAGFYNITKLYEDTGNESVETVRNAINKGQNIINHDGHANETYMGMGTGGFRNNDMQNLTNGSELSILYSIGCYPANFEANCIAEAFINNPNGGGIAFIGNSRYGWGSPGNPGYGYSDRYDAQFFRFLFKEKNYNIGNALSLAKAYYVPYARQENVYRWCMYEINLLGDPEMPVWTDIPDTLTVQYPLSVTTGNSRIPITVTSDGAPVKNALVCFMQGNDVYHYGKTGDTGQIIFGISPSNPAEKLSLTVTAANFLPYESSIDIISESAYVICSNYEIDDSQGNGDGLSNPGERINLRLGFKNYGKIAAPGVNANMSCANPFVTVEDTNIYAGDIAGGDSVECSDTFEVSVDSTCKNGDVFYLTMIISSSDGHEWDQILSLTCATPVLCHNYQQIDDSQYGNGNGVPEPGERITLFTAIRNEGLATAKFVQSSLTANDPNISIEQKTGLFGDIAPNETSVDSFAINISNSYSNLPAFPNIKMNLSTQDGYLFSLSFRLTIGNTGFEDNIENGQGNWQTPEQIFNHWHISSKLYHSGSYSWYCGDETSGYYFQEDSCILESPSFYVGQNAQLTFWAWYNVAIYGVNGFYVQISDDDGNTWHKLDFIGSGGALDSTLMGNDWLPYTYDLADFEPGTVAKIRFHWVSDSEPLPAGEKTGVFIDDIAVTSTLTMSMARKRIDLLPLPTEYKLFQNYPNPFNSFTKIDYQIIGKSYQDVELTIYNLLGQKVKTLRRERQNGGYYTVLWDGTNESGDLVSSGIYVYQLKTDDFKMEKKLLLLR